MIHVRLYASLRDRAGRGAVFLHWPEIGALAALREKLAEELPELKDALREVPFLVAVNHTMANEDTPIKDGDEVGLMPPFSGGSRGETAFVSHPVGDVRIQTGDFSVDEEIRRIRAAGKNTGAVCTFLGTARDYSRGRSVEGLFFEHYPGLAEKE
ncbi:MAG TPA: MoaD/ThiS family protein, partial [Nitrospiria bacterium]|nr:MoaD/ThiS family protein [Nitrospiria bacterium]